MQRVANFRTVVKQATVTLPLSPYAFTAVDDEGKRVSRSKRFTLYIGGSQPDGRSVELLGQAPLKLEIQL